MEHPGDPNCTHAWVEERVALDTTLPMRHRGCRLCRRVEHCYDEAPAHCQECNGWGSVPFEGFLVSSGAFCMPYLGIPEKFYETRIWRVEHGYEAVIYTLIRGRNAKYVQEPVFEAHCSATVLEVLHQCHLWYQTQLAHEAEATFVDGRSS